MEEVHETSLQDRQLFGDFRVTPLVVVALREIIEEIKLRDELAIEILPGKISGRRENLDLFAENVAPAQNILLTFLRRKKQQLSSWRIRAWI